MFKLSACAKQSIPGLSPLPCKYRDLGMRLYLVGFELITTGHEPHTHTHTHTHTHPHTYPHHILTPTHTHILTPTHTPTHTHTHTCTHISAETMVVHTWNNGYPCLRQRHNELTDQTAQLLSVYYPNVSIEMELQLYQAKLSLQL